MNWGENDKVHIGASLGLRSRVWRVLYSLHALQTANEIQLRGSIAWQRVDSIQILKWIKTKMNKSWKYHISICLRCVNQKPKD